jgi:hypothetical protein
MPRRAFLDAAAEAGAMEASWDLVKELAETFDVSLTAAAIRFASLHPRRVAVAVFRDGAVAWSQRSWRWRLALARGMRAPAGSSVLAAPSRWRDEPVAGPARVWLEGASPDAMVLEHAFTTPQTGVVMALLERVAPEA